MNDVILNEVEKIKEYLDEIFCKLHSNPELSTQEFETQALILEELNKMGIEAKKIADTGVLGLIRGSLPGKTVAFRADMDALPITEETNLSYKSKNNGVMHACGHDSHVTILLGLAKILSSRKASLKGNVKLFFQPAEETIGGAKRMIEEGCMENPKVDAVFFSHCSLAPVGKISVRPGTVSANSTAISITFKGKGCHGSSPHIGNDVIVAASQAVLALQTICSRRTAPTDSLVLSIGQFNAGTAPNIWPETAELNGTMRTIDLKTRERASNDIRQIVNGIASAMGVDVDIKLKYGYTSTYNDEDMTKLVINSAKKIVGENNIKVYKTPSMGLEDVGCFINASKGCYYNFGVATENEEIYPVHNPKFKVNKDGLVIGTAMYLQIAEDFLNG